MLSCAAAAAPALDAGSAAGRLQLDGRTVQLSSAIALDYRDRAGLAALAGDTPALRIALSAAPLPADALEGPGNQRLRAAIARFDTPVILLKLDGAAHGKVAHARVEVLAAQGGLVASADTAGLSIARGKRRVLGALDITLPAAHLQLQARFSAPLFEDRAADVVALGEAARASPQVQALLTYEQALRQGAFARARAQATATLQATLADLESRDEGAISALVADLMPPAARRRSIVRLVQVGDMAWLVEAAQPPRLTPLSRVGGRWRVDVP